MIKLNTTHINHVRIAFEKMQSREDLLCLLNEVKPLVYADSEKSIPFKIKQLTWYSNPKLGKKRYSQFQIKKKSGANRYIHAPVNGLKSLQKTLSFILQCVFEPHNTAMGFVKGKSIIDNAKLHVGSIYVYNIDLKDFFPSVDQARVWKCLQLKPFNLSGEKRLPIANIIASLCCTEMNVERKKGNDEWETVNRSVLPQGAPTSPVITNIICQRLDYLLSSVAKRFGLKYSRYADDITFSSMHNVYQPESEFLKELYRIIAQQGFNIKEEKTRLQKNGYRKEVTGLLVNEKVNVQKRYIKYLRMWLYYWERYGYERAYTFFLQQYIADKKNLTKSSPDMVNIIRGKLDYLRMVKGEEDRTYMQLKERVEKLMVRKVKPSDEEIITEVLDVSGKQNINITEEYLPQLTSWMSEDSAKFYRSAVSFIGDIMIGREPERDEKGPLKNYREAGFGSLETENIEISAKDKKKRTGQNFDLNTHRPQDLTAFLALFRSGDHPFKYLVHDFIKPGEIFVLSEFIQKVENSFYLETKKFSISQALYARLKAFIGLSREQWSLRFKGISRDFSFSSDNVKKWCEDHPNKHPIFGYSSEIKLFTEGIRIERNLEALINSVLLEKNLEDFHIEYVNLKEATFDTDIEALLSGLGIIFNTIRQRAENSKRLKIIFQENLSSKGEILSIIKIIHCDSNCDKSLNEDVLFKGDLKSAKSYFYRLCDWSIIANNLNSEVNKINILFNASSNVKKQEKLDEVIEGFTHILTFYT
ncbi:MAG: reverse transcriptase family protein [Bacteroidia bacterium]|nr:reverse transcriptase family protein [Bacteroidia bacterium]